MKKNKLYFGEVLKADGFEHKSPNTLFLAPVGSGKTFFILEDLLKRHSGKKLLVVSTTSLKESLEEEKEIVTTKDLRRRGRKLGDEELHMVTYAELGTLVKFSSEFLDEYSLVVCDEVHSLFEYYMMEDSVRYAFVIHFLFTPSTKRSVYYFTATLDKVDTFVRKEKIDILKSVETINYLDDERILRYLNIHEMEFSGLDELDSLIFNLKDLREAGKKGVIFNELIAEMKETEEILKKKGYRAISIWSVNNAKNPMTKEQLSVRAHLLKTGIIPDGYDFLIINESMREGWNLIDEAVEVVIANTYDKTNIVQFRGRVRKDVYLMVVRSRQKTTTLNSKILKKAEAYGRLESYLDRDLSAVETKKLAEELNIKREENNTLVGFTTLSKAFKEGGYSVTPERKTINGKRAVYTTITKKEETKSSTKAKAGGFLKKLEHVNFILENEKHLDSYLGKGREVALNNIKNAYVYTTQDFGWKERKFTDVTYLITKDKEIYSRKNYNIYGKKLERMEEIEILEERARYESAAALELELAKEAKRAVESQDEAELLEYIKNHGG